MNMLRKFLLVLSLIGFSGVGIAADASLAGDWELTVETGQGSGTPQIQLKQNGNALSGTYKSSMLGEAPLTGTVNGNDFTFSVKLDAQGQQLTILYSGTVDGSSMKGKASMGDMGEGTFTGKRK
jgi:hypothetical protein